MSSSLVFISYVREDIARAVALAQALREGGLSTWIDIENIVVGERWESAIDKGLRDAGFIVVCVSKNSISKRGFAQRELKRALYVEESMLDGDIFLLPVRFDSCEIPSNLRDFQYLDINTPSDYLGVTAAIAEGCRRRGIELIVNQHIEIRETYPQVDLSDLGGGGLLASVLGRGKRK